MYDKGAALYYGGILRGCQRNKSKRKEVEEPHFDGIKYSRDSWVLLFEEVVWISWRKYSGGGICTHGSFYLTLL